MIGVFGGTFDPIHFGHLRPALDIMDELGLKQMRFIPCGQPAHRASPRTPAHVRLELVQAAISAETRFVADDREIQREGPSYTVDTLISLKQDFPDSSLCLVLGRDAFLHLPTWDRWQQLLDLAHIAVMTRPQRELPGKFEPVLASLLEHSKVDDPQRLHQQSCGLVIFCQVTQLDISATSIRAMVADGQNPAFMVPEKVMRLIRERKLYVK